MQLREGDSIYEPRKIHLFVIEQIRDLVNLMMVWTDGIVDKKDMQNILQMLADEMVE